MSILKYTRSSTLVVASLFTSVAIFDLAGCGRSSTSSETPGQPSTRVAETASPAPPSATAAAPDTVVAPPLVSSADANHSLDDGTAASTESADERAYRHFMMECNSQLSSSFHQASATMKSAVNDMRRSKDNGDMTLFNSAVDTARDAAQSAQDSCNNILGDVDKKPVPGRYTKGADLFRQSIVAFGDQMGQMASIFARRDFDQLQTTMDSEEPKKLMEAAAAEINHVRYGR